MNLQHSQQLSVEDADDSGALQAVGGSAALALLEAVRQSLDVIPCAEILQRKQNVRAFCDYIRTLERLTDRALIFGPVEDIAKYHSENKAFTLAASKFFWTEGLGHLPGLMT